MTHTHTKPVENQATTNPHKLHSGSSLDRPPGSSRLAVRGPHPVKVPPTRMCTYPLYIYIVPDEYEHRCGAPQILLLAFLPILPCTGLSSSEQEQQEEEPLPLACQLDMY